MDLIGEIEPPHRHAKEKAQARHRAIAGLDRGPGLHQVQLELPHLVDGGRIRRALQPGGKPFAGTDVADLCALGQLPGSHILQHALAGEGIAVAGDGANVLVFQFVAAGLELADEHRAGNQVLMAPQRAGERGQVVRHEVRREDRRRLREPPEADLREQDALTRDAVGHDRVEGREAVRSHDEQFVFADGVVVAHLAARQQGQGIEGRRVQCL